jgi:hypothetical protein
VSVVSKHQTTSSMESAGAKVQSIKSNVIWTTLYCDNLLDNQITQRYLGSGTKIKAIERKKVKVLCEYERESCHKSYQKMVDQISFQIHKIRQILFYMTKQHYPNIRKTRDDQKE